MYVCVYIYIYMYTHVYICMYTYEHMYIFTYKHIFIYIHKYICVYLYIYACRYVSFYAYMYIYIYTSFSTTSSTALAPQAHMWVLHDVSFMTYLYPWLKAYVFTTRRIHIYGMTNLSVRHDSFTCVTRLIRRRVTWLITMWDTTRLYVWRDVFICVRYAWHGHCCISRQPLPYCLHHRHRQPKPWTLQFRL